MNSLQHIIRKKLKEVLDFDEKNIQKKSKTSFVDTEFEPLSATKIVNIDGSNIKISFFIDEFDNSLEISFTDDKNTFSLTNKNIIAKVLNTLKFQTSEFFKDLNNRMLKSSKTLKINKIIITPTKIRDKDTNLDAIQTSRGKIFNFFITKVLDGAYMESNKNTITYNLKKPLKFGYSKTETYF